MKSLNNSESFFSSRNKFFHEVFNGATLCLKLAPSSQKISNCPKLAYKVTFFAKKNNAGFCEWHNVPTFSLKTVQSIISQYLH